MKYLNQVSFTVPSDAADLETEPLVIHMREIPATDRALIVLIHGMGGKRYDYWGNLPEYLWQDFKEADLGLYDYQTAGRRGQGAPSIELEDEAAILADILISLRAHARVVLLGHSMGGLLAKGTIARLIEMRNKAVLKRVRGVVLLASPQLGSLKVPSWLRWLSRDARALAPHNRYLRRVDTLFESRVKLSVLEDNARPYNIPVWALYSPGDFWVDPTSASIGLPESQRRAVRGDHGSVIRPPHREADSYAFVGEAIKGALTQAGMRSRRTQDIECRAATFGDFPGIMELAERMFGGTTPPEQNEMFAQLVREYPESMRVVCRVTQSPRVRHEVLLGYSCVMPLTGDAASAIKDGKLAADDIRGRHIVRPDERPEVVYVGAVAAIDAASRAVVLEALRSHLHTFRRANEIEILARAATADGLRLVTRNHFTPLSGRSEIGTLFKFCRPATP